MRFITNSRAYDAIVSFVLMSFAYIVLRPVLYVYNKIQERRDTELQEYYEIWKTYGVKRRTLEDLEREEQGLKEKELYELQQLAKKHNIKLLEKDQVSSTLVNREPQVPSTNKAKTLTATQCSIIRKPQLEADIMEDQFPPRKTKRPVRQRTNLPKRTSRNKVRPQLEADVNDQS